eukprot:TRINITY_DN7345_c0_g1_i3.p1 TRINITY_DN7345_c0_g1~~TRINITY_DN7345_c0_g1_i3.p1  ORF type:complete len:323 (+),score=55.75 TRINITY_DN7345_c0_g1_i3:162-1130(+)
MAEIVEVQNYLPSPPFKIWNNRIYLVRHGQSKANEVGLIVSGREGLSDKFGLTSLGECQAREAAGRLEMMLPKDNDPVVITSDFARARQTAAIIAQELRLAAPMLDKRLRERYFGGLDLGPSQHYKDVWECDRVDASHHSFQVEPVLSVIARTTQLVFELERTHVGKDIILVAHGDVLQILQTWFVDADPRHHRQFPGLKTGDARQVTANVGTGIRTVHLELLAADQFDVDEPRPRVLNSSVPSTGANSPSVSASPLPATSSVNTSRQGASPVLSDIAENRPSAPVNDDDAKPWLWMSLVMGMVVAISGVCLARYWHLKQRN